MKPGLRNRVTSELRRFAVITLYLWVLLALFRLHKAMVLHAAGVHVWEQSFAIINALILAKLILIGQDLKMGAGLRKYRLVYSVLGHALFFTIVLIGFEILEKAIRAVVKGLPFATTSAEFGGGTLQGFLTVGAILFVMLIPLFVVQEVGNAIGGPAPLWNLFFSSGEKKFRLVEE